MVARAADHGIGEWFATHLFHQNRITVTLLTRRLNGETLLRSRDIAQFSTAVQVCLRQSATPQWVR
ncbi:hypothetical protein O9992_23935 [Vibrio lentus]|nr:hypothetical protein [Vibrio lentus]